MAMFSLAMLLLVFVVLHLHYLFWRWYGPHYMEASLRL